MKFVDSTERLPEDIHRQYWCRVKMKPLVKRKKGEIPYRHAMGSEMTPEEIERLNQEVFCLPLSPVVLNGNNCWVSDALNYSHLAASIEWLENDGSTPSDKLVNPPRSYKEEKLREYEKQNQLDLFLNNHE